MYNIEMIIVSTIVTALIRITPFMLFKGKKTPDVIIYLGDVLPYSIMAMLVVYCLKDVDFTTAPFGLTEILASLITIILQIKKKNTLISVIVGTISYMILIRVI